MHLHILLDRFGWQYFVYVYCSQGNRGDETDEGVNQYDGMAGGQSHLIPTEADIIFGYSTVPGMLA